MGVTKLTRINVAIIAFVLIVAALVLAYIVNIPSNFGQILVTKQEGISEKNQAKFNAVLDEANRGELTLILDNNPALMVSLSEQIQGSPLNIEFSEAVLKQFSSSAAILKKLLTLARNGYEHEQFILFEKEKLKLANYLLAYTSLKRKQGEGVISVHDSMTQISLAQASSLLFELQKNQGSHEKLSQLAHWYSIEKEAMLEVRVFEVALLHNAWELSAEIIKHQLDSFDIESQLSRDSDLIRLLNHQNSAVAANAAVLIRYFSPENAITALRFQLARSEDRQFSFRLLDALKSYGPQRSQFEPQLKKMLRMSQDSDLQHKIMETIDHLHGRSNELLSKNNQTK